MRQMSSSMAWARARRLGEAKPTSTARYDDDMSSSVALTVFSGRASSRMGWRRLFLLCVVKGRPQACLTTRCRRARFFVAHDDMMQYSICSNVHYREP